MMNNDIVIEGYLRRSKKEVIAKKAKKHLSTFNIMMYLIGFALVSILYISNIVAVNTVVREISQLERQFEIIRNENEILRAEYHRLTGLEYIGTTAFERLGMQYPNQSPEWITLKAQEVENLKNALKGINP